MAEQLARETPGLVTAVMAKARRRGKVFVDWSQNNPHKTTIASYSLRGRARPTVATPVTWDEVRGLPAPGRPGVHRGRPAGPDRRARRPDGRAARRAAAAAASRLIGGACQAGVDAHPTPVPRRRLPAGLRPPRLAPGRARRLREHDGRVPPRGARGLRLPGAGRARQPGRGGRSCTTTRCWTAPPTARGPIAARTAAELAAVLVRGREPLPRLEQVLTELPDTRITVELKSGAAVAPVLDAAGAHRQLAPGLPGQLPRRLAGPGPAGWPGRGCAPRSGRRRRSGCAAGPGWTRCPGPAPRLPGPPVIGQPGPAAAPLRPAHRGRRRRCCGRPTRPAARCTCGRSNDPAEMAELLDLGRRRAAVRPPRPAARACWTAAAPGPPRERASRVPARLRARGRVARLGAVGLGLLGVQRGDRDVRVRRVPDRRRGRRPARRGQREQLAGLRAGRVRAAGRRAGPGDRAAGRRGRAAQAARSGCGPRWSWPARPPCTWSQDDSRWFALGLVLLGLGSIFFELASVSYNALLVGVSTPATIGRVSGFGWAMGYLGGIVLLLGRLRRVHRRRRRAARACRPTNGFNIRLVALVAAGWFAVFALPLFLLGARAGRRPAAGRRGSGLLAPTARCSPTCARCTGAPRTPSTSWPPARCTGTASPRSSPSAGCSRSPSTASTRPTC